MARLLILCIMCIISIAASAQLNAEIIANPLLANKELLSFITSQELEAHEHIELTLSSSVDGAVFHVADATGTIITKHDIAAMTPSEFTSLVASEGFVRGAPGSAKRAKMRNAVGKEA